MNTSSKIIFLGLLLISTLGFTQKKNVLFIAVDDLKPLIGAYGDEMAVTPNLDRLASMGTTFTNAHCQQAVCAPSRVSLLTGLRPDLTEVWDLQTQMRDKNPGILTMPEHFWANGYTTVGMGKIFDPRSVDRKLDENSWSVPFIDIEVNDKVHGEDITGFQSPENKKKLEAIRDQGRNEGIPDGKMWAYIRDRYKPSTESFDISDEGYFDGAMTVEAIKHLEKLGKKSDPFFLAVGFNKPHLPFVAPKKYWDLYKREEMPLAEYQKWARGTIKLSYHNIGELKSYTDIPDSFEENGLLNEGKQRELIHGYYACVSYIDSQVGKLLEALESNGLKENTTIVFWGDHGWHLGDHGLWNKHSNFEQATRSPMIFVDPGMKSGIINPSPTEFVDVFPTLLDLTGLPVPDHLQGKSLKPIMSGKVKSVKDFSVSQYPRGPVMGYALRTDRYRYVAWYKNKSTIAESDILFKELYDYRKDPNETVNIVGVERDLAAELQAKLTEFLSTQLEQKKAFKKLQPEVIRSTSSNPSVNSGSLGENLLVNPGFENGEKKWITGGDCPISVVEKDAKSGASSLLFDGTGCSAFQNLEGLKPNTSYQASAFIKTENNVAAALKIRYYGGEDISVRYTESNYGEVTTTFTTGPEITSARIALVKYAEGSGKTWFDDISVKEIGAESSSIDGPSIRDILNTKYNNELYVGATTAYRQLGTLAEDIIASQFNYTVPENAAKQTRVHPDPDTWNWTEIDAILDMASKNDLMVRLHGPISPQASWWAKDDKRTAEELEPVMIDYMTEQCKRFNGHPNVKWMDVVNETVTPEGDWFGPKEGVKEWENPWTIIGSDTDKNKTPVYISKAFEIANELAPDVSQVFNQHGGMEPEMWERVKETILYLRGKGLRVDGLGWQAHLRSNIPLAHDPNQLKYLGELIDWAHANKLDFHVTEIDYSIYDEVNEKNQRLQADAYSNILKVLLSRRSTGVVTFNSWGITDRSGEHTDKSRFLFDENGRPKPAFYELRRTLSSDDLTLETSSSKILIEEGFNLTEFPKGWITYGDARPYIDSGKGMDGTAGIAFTADKCGVIHVVKDLKPNTSYRLEMWSNMPSDQKITLKVAEYGGEELKNYIFGSGEYQKGILEFTTGPNSTSAKVAFSRFHPDWSGPVYVDNFKMTEIE